MAKSFLFLPDISGFTDFVSHTEISHSQHIIAELLEVLLEANDLELELAEIEGDALFFYKEGVLPSYEEILHQVEHMFLAFHNHLRRYDHQRICECGACQSAAQLQLKFFAHAGEIQFVEIREFKKPHGRDVILVHRLMKNKVSIKEYLLLSEALTSEFTHWDDISSRYLFQAGDETYDTGEVHYKFTSLVDLKHKLNELPKYTGHEDSADPILVSGHIDMAPKKLLELISNLKYRHLWNKGASRILFDDNHLNRSGSEHVCVINGREVVLETISKPREDHKLVYGEKTADFPLMKQFVNYFVIEADDERSKLTIEGHLQSRNIIGRILKPIFRRKLKTNFELLFKNLTNLASDFKTSL